MKSTIFICKDEKLLEVEFLYEPIKEIWAHIRIKEAVYTVSHFVDEFPGHSEVVNRYVFLLANGESDLDGFSKQIL